MSSKKCREFEKIVQDILEKKEFQALDYELHHGISRYKHSLRVAKSAYKISKRLHWNYTDITRAALLHDFFLDKQLKKYNTATTFYKHPEIALENAKKYFSINIIQENAILSHMFPSSKVFPKYKESWLVTFVDKFVSIYEMYRFKASLVLGIWTIFFFNVITMQK